MKKYLLYEWCTEDEGGFGVCLTSEYSTDNTYKIGTFDTLEELTEVLLFNYPEYYETYELALSDARDLYVKAERER